MIGIVDSGNHGDQMPVCDVPAGFERRAEIWWCGDDTEYGCDCTQPMIYDIKVRSGAPVIPVVATTRYLGEYFSRDRDNCDYEKRNVDFEQAKKRWSVPVTPRGETG